MTAYASCPRGVLVHNEALSFSAALHCCYQSPLFHHAAHLGVEPDSLASGETRQSSRCSPGRLQRRPSMTRMPTLRSAGRQQALLRVACTPGLQHMLKEMQLSSRWDWCAGVVHRKETSHMETEHSNASSQPLLLDSFCEGGLSHMYE